MRLLNRSLNGLAGRISRRRRGPFAGLAMLLLALLVTGGLYAAFAPATTAKTEASSAAQIAEGRELFLVGCSFCHGTNGEGVLTKDGKQQIGPSLVGVGAAAVDFQVGTGRMPAAQPGPQFPAKKTAYSQAEIDALAAYVASLGPGPAIPDASEYSSAGMTEEELQAAITRGGQIFLTNCSACHNFEGSGGAMPQGKKAPALHQTTPLHIYEAMLTGPAQMDRFSNGNLPPEEKRDVILYLESLRENPSYGGFEMGGLGPVSEGMFAWLVGIGGLVGFAVWIAAHSTRSSKKKVKA